jgi:hypothetical protein
MTTQVLDSGNAGRPFDVNGDTFVNLAGALQRSCDQQFNGCANLANAGDADISTAECQAQKGKFFSSSHIIYFYEFPSHRA